MRLPDPARVQILGWQVVQISRFRWRVTEEWSLLGIKHTSNAVDALTEAGARRWIARRRRKLDKPPPARKSFTIPRHAQDGETDEG